MIGKAPKMPSHVAPSLEIAIEKRLNHGVGIPWKASRLISRRRSLWSEALVAQGAAMGDLSAFVAISCPSNAHRYALRDLDPITDGVGAGSTEVSEPVAAPMLATWLHGR
jgi:hypothetical protein